MQTKYNTGDKVMVPATIRSAREENGKVTYEIDGDFWGGIPEEQIIIDERASAARTFDESLREMSRADVWF